MELKARQPKVSFRPKLPRTLIRTSNWLQTRPPRTTDRPLHASSKWTDSHPQRPPEGRGRRYAQINARPCQRAIAAHSAVRQVQGPDFQVGFEICHYWGAFLRFYVDKIKQTLVYMAIYDTICNIYYSGVGTREWLGNSEDMLKRTEHYLSVCQAAPPTRKDLSTSPTPPPPPPMPTRHAVCIEDPPGVTLYTKTGPLKKGTVVLPTFRCARGSTSLKPSHLHLSRFISGK